MKYRRQRYVPTTAFVNTSETKNSAMSVRASQAPMVPFKVSGVYADGDGDRNVPTKRTAALETTRAAASAKKVHVPNANNAKPLEKPGGQLRLL